MMKQFKGFLTLSKNSRGCYILDSVKGCSIVKVRLGGCYGACYANNIAMRYGFNFGEPVVRRVRDDAHRTGLIRQMQKAPVEFIRIGEMGDPSENWEHTLSIVPLITESGKACVIITKHWNKVPEKLLPMLCGTYINTSVSALDSDRERIHRLEQYERLKPWCNSILRVVSCKFNMDSEEGRNRDTIQTQILAHGAINTVFRPSPENEFLTRGVIIATPRKFLKQNMLASTHDKGTHFGECSTCPDQCGLNPPTHCGP